MRTECTAKLFEFEAVERRSVVAGFDVTAKDAKGHAARIAKEIPMFKKIIEDAGITKL